MDTTGTCRSGSFWVEYVCGACTRPSREYVNIQRCVHTHTQRTLTMRYLGRNTDSCTVIRFIETILGKLSRMNVAKGKIYACTKRHRNGGVLVENKLNVS